MPAAARFPRNPIPARAGIGLRAQHYRDVLEQRPAAGWLEVHSENYFGAGGAPLHYLERIREHYPLSLHGVGLSLGSADTLSPAHLENLRTLIARVEPALVSEHLCWSSIGGRYLNDLAPLPYTTEALRHVSLRIRQAQDFLGVQLLIENVSSYLEYQDSTIPEWEFLAAVAQASGCGILLDINNIYVNSVNHGFDASEYLHAITPAAVQEMHLAGFSVNRYEDGEILIDTHGARVAAPVWSLYREAVQRFGAVPTLIEWDTDVPPLAVLLDEMHSADEILRAHRRVHVA